MSDPISPLLPRHHSKTGSSLYWQGLKGSAAALAIAQLAAERCSPLLLICQSGAEAVQLEAELGFYLQGLPLLHFADWETLPYDNFSPHQDIVSERLKALYEIPTMAAGVIVCSISNLMHRLAPPSFIAGSTLLIKAGQQFNIEAQRAQLQEAGYICVDTVYEHGEFAVRGSLLDIFPMGSDRPYRIDLFDDEVDSLRSFDPETQRSQDKVAQIELLAAKEFPVEPEAIRQFKRRWAEEFSNSDPKACSIYQDISAGISPAGIEYYLPLFFEQCASLFDYLPKDTLCLLSGDCHSASENFWREISERYQNRAGDIERPLLKPERIFLGAGEVFGALKNYPRIEINPAKDSPDQASFSCRTPPELSVNPKSDNPLTALEAFLMQTQARVLFSAESAGRRESLLDLLRKNQITPTEVGSWQEFLASDHDLAVVISPLDRGLHLAADNIAIVCESQLFGQRVQQRRRRKAQQSDHSDFVVKNLAELNPGAAVVHIDHGVGRYRGLETISTDGQANEFLMLEYADAAKLYVPVANLHLIARYSGAENAPLHRLGTEQWQKAKRKAAEKVRDVAAELLDIYARRAARKGFKFRDPKQAYDDFATGFPFEETPDQQNAIEAVFTDMTQDKAMDRLVCGDVGFGKTEVAMRAAFLAVHSGKQVAMLVPTTLLAQQHYENFKDRFADWPVNIEVVSRFRSGKETSAVEKQLADGKVDIIIGTHKLIQGGLNYKSLGLLIIDEEHRFGVRQKEQLKSLRS
ncbi:MAG: DEAD/DEAH box helicase, partial [Cellvibrionaceae bacterium]|nr:DEAD/DEAH box helicase [Cellvibrionaceae bacterium]